MTSIGICSGLACGERDELEKQAPALVGLKPSWMDGGRVTFAVSGVSGRTGSGKDSWT